MHHDAQGVLSLGWACEKPQEVTVRKEKRRYRPRGLVSEKEKNRRRKEYFKNRERVLARAKERYRLNREDKIADSKEYYRENRARILEKTRVRNGYCAKPRESEKELVRRRETEKEKQKRWSSAWHSKNKERVLRLKYQRDKIRRKEDEMFAMRARLRTRVAQALRSKGGSKTTSTEILLGCSFLEFRKHIESQFTEGMCWENRRLWHLDHIIPLAAFNLLDQSQLEVACHFTNIQPLWASINLTKKDTITAKIRQRMNEVFGKESIAA